MKERDEIAEHLQIWKNQLTTGRTALSQYELISGQYEEAASRLEETKKKKAAEEQRLEMAEEQVADRIDAWITEVFHRAETSEEWHPEREVLLQAEQKARRYDTVADGVEIQGDFRADYERQRQQLTDAKNEKQYQREIQEGILKDVREQLKKVQEQQELEPERDETVEKIQSIPGTGRNHSHSVLQNGRVCQRSGGECLCETGSTNANDRNVGCPGGDTGRFCENKSRPSGVPGCCPADGRAGEQPFFRIDSK